MATRLSFMSICLFALGPFATSLRADSPKEVHLPMAEKFHLFLLVGQSNMAGRGKIEREDLVPHPRVLMLTKDNRWTPAVAPLHFDKPSVVGVGLGRTFGIQIAEANKDVTVGLIPCAVGGSPIASWQPGGFHRQTNSHPYDDTLRRVKVALQVGTLKGILWHQGESDGHPETSRVYEQKLHALIRRFRTEFEAPNVPFLAGQMGQFPERPWSEDKKRVDQAHRALVERVPHTAFIESNGLTHRGDKVHFSAASYREFGKRYARAFLEMSN